MRFKDLKIGTKIMTGFAVVALITLAVGVIGYTGLSRVAKSFHDVADVRMPSIEYLKEMEIGYENYRVAQRTLLNPNLGAEDKARQFQNIAKARERYTKAMEMFEPLEQTQEEAILWKEFKEKLAQWRNTNLEFEKEIDNLTQIDIFYPMQFLKDLQTFKEIGRASCRERV